MFIELSKIKITRYQKDKMIRRGQGLTFDKTKEYMRRSYKGMNLVQKTNSLPFSPNKQMVLPAE